MDGGENSKTNKDNVDLVDKLNNLKDEYNYYLSKKKVLKDHESILKEY